MKYSLKREGAFSRLREDTTPGNSVTEHCAQIVGLSEEYCSQQTFQRCFNVVFWLI